MRNHTGMHRLAAATALVALAFIGAIAGFFYAWLCSTMWGLDAVDPRVAIAAMQAMNASVRNVVFFPAFFLTPVALILAAAAAWVAARPAAAGLFAAAAAVYFGGALVPTTLVNVPMNEALALVETGDDAARAGAVWAEYSGRWQAWNLARTVASFVALLLAGMGLLTLPAAAPPPPANAPSSASRQRLLPTGRA